MIELSRTVRFCLNGPGAPGSESPEAMGLGRNTFSAWPAMRGLGRYYELTVRCKGVPDPVTGCFINIKVIDQAVWAWVLPYLEGLICSGPRTCSIAMGAVLRRVCGLLQDPLEGSVTQVHLGLSPFHSLAIRSRDMDHVLIRQQYEFAAAHRLHARVLNDQQNREVFGKCNNPSGHGHNYRLEVCVRSRIDPAGHVVPVDTLDAMIDRVVLMKLDHKHLNLDVPQFAELNPTVENIAKVIYEMIDSHIGEVGLELVDVSVWETGKTVCTYSGHQGSGPEQPRR